MHSLGEARVLSGWTICGVKETRRGYKTVLTTVFQYRIVTTERTLGSSVVVSRVSLRERFRTHEAFTSDQIEGHMED